jgi:hypothetical protein
MTCSRCGAPLPRPDVRFCTACGAPVGQQPGGSPPAGSGYPPPGQQGQYPPGPGQYPPQPGNYPAPGQPGPYPPQPGQYPPQPYQQQQQYGPPPSGQPGPSTSFLVPILAGAAVLIVLLGGVGFWLLTQMADPPIAIGRAEPTRTPAPTVVPTPTRQPGIGINIPGPGGTPTQITIPLPIPGLGASGTPGADGAPQLPITIPGLSGTPGVPVIPGSSGTPPPDAKLTADSARQKVKDTISTCRVLQAQVEASQVTFEPPNWTVRLPLTGATWTVNDDTGAVTADERAAERARTCRI